MSALGHAMGPTWRRLRAALTTLGILFWMQLTSMRWFWRSVLLGGFFTPLFALLFWQSVVAGSRPQADAVYFLAGNVTVSLLFGNMGRVASRFAFLRSTGALDYYATLRVGKVTLILGVVLAFLAMSLPGVVAALGVGTLWLGVSVHPHPALALVLGSVALAALGAAVGVYSRTPEQSDILEYLLSLALTVLSPVVVPIERLPRVLRWTSYLVPTTYATQAVRTGLTSQLDARFWLNLGILLAFCGVTLALVARKLDWRA